MPSDTYEHIWNVIARIPYGKVANYGQIARIAGLGQRARLVGYALHSTPDGIDMPWHRVINAQGRISFPEDSSSYLRQRELLEAEGIVFVAGRVDFACYRWQPDTEDWPPEYLEAESSDD
jgi:methylated-DNA-protein-cysteine methyltransferase-like protein